MINVATSDFNLISFIKKKNIIDFLQLHLVKLLAETNKWHKKKQ